MTARSMPAREPGRPWRRGWRIEVMVYEDDEAACDALFDDIADVVHDDKHKHLQPDMSGCVFQFKRTPDGDVRTMPESWLS